MSYTILAWVPKLHWPSVHHAEFHSTEQRMSSVSGDRECSYDIYRVFLWSYQCANMDTGVDPQIYTSGRWLRRDKLERESRYILFDFDALCQRVVELCPRAVSIATFEKAEGFSTGSLSFHHQQCKKFRYEVTPCAGRTAQVDHQFRSRHY
jgi:hypothetical protein